MKKRKIWDLCLRAASLLCGVGWYVGIFALAFHQPRLSLIFVAAQVCGAAVAFMLTRSPGMTTAAFFFPMVTNIHLAFRGLFIKHPLFKWQRDQALWNAYRHQDAGEIERLLRKKVDRDRSLGKGETYLTDSYREGRLSIFNVMLQGGVDPNRPGVGGWTPLMLASHKGDLETVRLLLERGADVNARNKEGWTPLMLACEKGHMEAIRLLLANQARIDLANANQATPFYIAAANQRLDAARLLLERRADVNAPEKDGWTPFMFAVYKDNKEVVEFLAANKANIHAVNQAGCSALFIAAANGREGMVGRLLDMGSEIDHPDGKGETPVQAALRKQHLGAVGLLLSRGAVADAALLEKVAAARAKPERSEAVPPVFAWSGDDFAGGDSADVELLRSESKAALSWFAAQNFVPIPTALGEKGAAEYCFDMATMAQNSGVWKEAWAGFHQALRRYARLGEDKMTGLTCFNLGKVYGAQSNWRMAELMFRQSAGLASRGGEEKGLAWALFYLGDVRQKRGDKSECRYYWVLAQQIFDRISPGDARNVEAALAKL